MGKAKLSRDEVIEILERNVQLYRNDESFTTYLADLTLYLVEYEYDWSTSGAHPALRDPKDVEPSRLSRILRQAEMYEMALKHESAKKYGQRPCPQCGKLIGAEKLCPFCLCMTR